MTQEQISERLIEVTTPFLDRHNDYTQIYIEDNEDGTFIVSDKGYTLSDLEMCGVEFNTQKKKTLLIQTLNRLGIKHNKDTSELYVSCNKEELPEVQHRVMQGMLDINDMFYLSTPTVRSLFLDDVKKFFNKNKIYYSENISVAGKSGFSHSFPFMLQRNENNPERFIRLINSTSRSNIERAIFSWDDTRQNREKDTKLIICINDSGKINTSNITGFNEYGIDYFFWSDRGKNISKLA